MSLGKGLSNLWEITQFNNGEHGFEVVWLHVLSTFPDCSLALDNFIVAKTKIKDIGVCVCGCDKAKLEYFVKHQKRNITVT